LLAALRLDVEAAAAEAATLEAELWSALAELTESVLVLMLVV